MSDDDIVEQLDQWIEQSGRSDWRAMLQRARDEIVALRAEREEMAVPVIDANSKLRDEVDLLRNALHSAELDFVSARDEALEQAAKVCDRLCEDEIEDGDQLSLLCHVAREIRALKKR